MKWKDMPLFSEKDGNPPIDADEKAGAVAKAINGASESIEKLPSAKHYKKNFNNDFVKELENFNKKHKDVDHLMVSEVSVDPSGTRRRKATINKSALKADYKKDRLNKGNNIVKFFYAFINMGSDTLKCLFDPKKCNVKDIFRYGINPNLMDVAKAVLGIYEDYKTSMKGKAFTLIAQAFGGLYNAVVKLGRFVEAKCTFDLSSFFNGFLICAKVMMDFILLFMEFGEKFLPKTLIKLVPYINVLLQLLSLIQAFIDIVHELKAGKKVSVKAWVGACCAVGSFICSSLGMCCMFFPGVGTAFAAGLKAMQVGFDAIPLMVELLEWLKENSAKVVYALKCIALPNRGGHAICQHIRDYWIGHDVSRTDNQVQIFNQLHEKLTVYTYTQYDVLKGASVAYWQETIKPGKHKSMAAGQEANQPFKVQFEHPQITSWTGTVYIKFWAKKGDIFYIKNNADKGKEKEVLVYQKRGHTQWAYNPKTMHWSEPYNT